MNAARNAVFQTARALVKVAVGFYFRRIEQFHTERAPLTGPAIFASNHPCSLTDAFVIGTSLHRRVFIVATAQLFGFKPLAWLLRQIGVIPINRLKDDPKAMRSVFATFEACFKVLERGEAIIIFPEGITHDDPQLKTVKSGAARMALELEHRHAGRLGLQVVPVGLTFSAKDRYRSEVLLQLGEPIQVSEFVPAYEQRRKECITDLTAEIERRIQSLILHLPQLQHSRLVDGVKQLYLERLRLGNWIITEPLAPRAEDLVLTQAIASAIQYFEREQPVRLAAFARRLDRYQQWLRRLQLSDETIASLAESSPGIGAAVQARHRGGFLARTFGLSLLAVIGAPIALYGWAHRLVPVLVVRWATRHLTAPDRRKAQTATAAILAGAVSFTVFYGLCIWTVHHFFGWPVSLWYGVSLPLAGLMAHFYTRQLRRLVTAVRESIVLLRVPLVKKRLLARRAELIAEIEAMREDYRRTLRLT